MVLDVHIVKYGLYAIAPFGHGCGVATWVLHYEFEFQLRETQEFVNNLAWEMVAAAGRIF